MGCGCGDCEEMMQPYLDRVLSEDQQREAQAHLEACPPCEKRYHFELTLRRYVRVATYEPIPPELKQKLSGLRAAR